MSFSTTSEGKGFKMKLNYCRELPALLGVFLFALVPSESYGQSLNEQLAAAKQEVLEAKGGLVDLVNGKLVCRSKHQVRDQYLLEAHGQPGIIPGCMPVGREISVPIRDIYYVRFAAASIVQVVGDETTGDVLYVEDELVGWLGVFEFKMGDVIWYTD